MLQKVAVGLILVSVFIGGSISYAHAQGLSVSQLIDLLVKAGIVPADKAAAARAAANSQTTPPACGLVRNLAIGSRGDDVKELQAKLGISNPTGYFGAQTLAAVKDFQSKNNLPATGYIGEMTRQKWANRYPCDKKEKMEQATTSTSTSTKSDSIMSNVFNVKVYQGGGTIAKIEKGSTYTIEWEERDVAGAVSLYLADQLSNWAKVLSIGAVPAGVKKFSWTIPTDFRKSDTKYRIYVESDSSKSFANVYFDNAYQY